VYATLPLFWPLWLSGWRIAATAVLVVSNCVGISDADLIYP